MKPTTDAATRARTRRVVARRWRHVLGRLERTLAREIAATALPPGAVVVDFGCADAPYRELFPPGVDYRGADLPGNELATLVLEGHRLPVADASVDFVLSTQVLEHVSDPVAYLAEAHRVLKPGGVLLLSTHGTFMFHPDPDDFWRWTHAGLRWLVGGRGFGITGLHGVVGAVPTAIQYLVDHLEPHVRPRWLTHALFWIGDLLVRATDALYSERGRKIGAMVYVLRAVKA